jgi:hypothetical protein
MLLKDFDDEIDQEWENLKPLIQFQRSKSHIHCIAHALNWVVQDILKELKSGTMQQTKNREIDVAQAGLIAKL